jgi:NIMA (never in mitosis gene a)-related kinase
VKRLEDGQEYALKKVKIQNLSDREKENALNEVRILASINNPFVAGYKQAFFDEHSSSLW